MCNKEFDTKEFDTNAEAVAYAFEAEAAGYDAVIDLFLEGENEKWIVDVYSPDGDCMTCRQPLAEHGDGKCYEDIIDELIDVRRGK